MPEETNRKIVDHIADINLTYSDIAREYLLEKVYLQTGSLRQAVQCSSTELKNERYREIRCA